MEHILKETSFSDEQLAEKISGGEIALFEILIRRYNPLLYKIARSYGLCHEDAEDAMQESYVAAYTQLRQFRQDASFKTWLTKIHLNKCYHKVNYGAIKYEQTGSSFINDNTAPMNVSKQDPEQSVDNKELGKLLEESLQHLPLHYRSVFLLREIEGFSVQETADLLNISAVNVKVRTNRAKALLQKQLEQYYSSAEIFEFHLKYCDKIVERVFKIISKEQ